MQHQLTHAQQQTLALAAVFQATQLVHVIAMSNSKQLGEAGRQHIKMLIQAALNIRTGENPNPDSLVFFQSLNALNLGLQTLEQSLVMPYDPHPKAPHEKLKLKNPKPALNYAMALLHLSAKVYRNPEQQQKINKTQQHILRQLAFFDYQYQHHSIIAALAQLYSETASTLTPKIMVKGSKDAFQDSHDVALIRALLFTGLQAAHYWRNLGGSPWKMIFAKGKILRDIRHLAELQHFQQQIEIKPESL
ncbi:MAG: DUF489 family protein [Acinetobacter sp.]|nr:MAG: DUF489 family protein [Acinetobacter sp.]